MPLYGSTKAAAVPETLCVCRKFRTSLNLLVFVNYPSLDFVKKADLCCLHMPTNTFFH